MLKSILIAIVLIQATPELVVVPIPKEHNTGLREP